MVAENIPFSVNNKHYVQRGDAPRLFTTIVVILVHSYIVF